jgi:hypothetical protein
MGGAPTSLRRPAPGLAVRAERVLRRNDAGGHTVPARGLYPHQWNWDSALAALGWARLDRGRAWGELTRLLDARAPDGMVPHIAFTPGVEGYLPGPEWWGADRRGTDGRAVSGITQPPVAATCLRLLHEAHPDRGRLADLVAPLADWHRALVTHRDPSGRGEPVVVHPWETGRDDATEWDAPLAAVVPTATAFVRRDTVHVDPGQRPRTGQYRRYLALVEQGRGHDARRAAGEAAFRVLDPALSAVLARAAHDLAALAAGLGMGAVAREQREIADAVETSLRARAGRDGLAPAEDLVAGRTIAPVGATVALQALRPGLPRHAVRALAAACVDGPLATPFGVRSHPPGPGFDARRYWRGPVWANVTYLTALGLASHGEHRAAAALTERLLRMASLTGMREYATAEGEGLGAASFTWTAALALWLA